MEQLLPAARPGAAPPWLLLLVPVAFLGITWLSNRLLGVAAMYREWPADPNDPVERNLGWQQVEFGAFRGHSPMSMKFGTRCLHLRQPFPFQLFWWRGPASIPWSEVRLVREPAASWWAFLSPGEFRLGAAGRMIRLRGKAARTLAERVKQQPGARPGSPAPGPSSPVAGPGAIRPR